MCVCVCVCVCLVYVSGKNREEEMECKDINWGTNEAVKTEDHDGNRDRKTLQQ